MRIATAAVPIPLNQAERAAPLDAAPKAPAGRLPLLAFVTDAATETAIIDGAAHGRNSAAARHARRHQQGDRASREPSARPTS